jgi:hypothetical protein
MPGHNEKATGLAVKSLAIRRLPDTPAMAVK